MSCYVVQNLQTSAVADGNGTVLSLVHPDQGVFTRLSVQVEGITTATVTFEVSNDGATYYAQDLAAVGTMETPVSAATADGMFVGAVCAQYFRTPISSFSAGTITVTVVAT